MPFLRERNGQFSPEKIGALLVVLLPLALLLIRAAGDGFAPADPFGNGGAEVGGQGLGGQGLGGQGLGAPGLGDQALGNPGIGAPGLGNPSLGGPPGDGPALGPRPYVEVIRFIGDWAIRLLLITLAVTPARRLFNWPKLLAARRTLGLGAAFLVGVHFVFFFLDIGSLREGAWEIVLRVYLTIGFIALLGLAALSATSWDGAIRRLGPARWAQLHMLVYPIVALGILHFFMQQKLDVTRPTLMAGLFLWLIGWRIMQHYGRGTGLLNMLALAVVAGISTALLEALWYLVATGVDPVRILKANLVFAYSIRPAWWVAGAGLAVALASELMLRVRPLPLRRSAQGAT